MGASDARHVPITCATKAVQGAGCRFKTSCSKTVARGPAVRWRRGRARARITKLGGGHSHRREERSERVPDDEDGRVVVEENERAKADRRESTRLRGREPRA